MNFALSIVFTTISVLLIWVFGPIALTPISYFAVQHAFRSEYKERKTGSKGAGFRGEVLQGVTIAAALLIGYASLAFGPRTVLIEFVDLLQSVCVFELGVSRAISGIADVSSISDELLGLNVIYWVSVFVFGFLLFYVFFNFGSFQRKLRRLLKHLGDKKINGTPAFLLGNVLAIVMNLALYTDFFLLDGAILFEQLQSQLLIACMLPFLGTLQVAIWVANKRIS